MAKKNGSNGNGHQLNGKELVTQAELAAVTSTIWNQRRQGMSVFDIAQSLGMPTSAVRKCIEESFAEYRENIQGKVEEEITLDLARLNLLIAQNLPIAQSIKVAVARRTVTGQTYTDEEYGYCLDAAKMVVDCIKEKAKILDYYHGKGERPVENNLLIWQTTVAPALPEKIANAKPVEPKQSSDPDFLDLDFDP